MVPYRVLAQHVQKRATLSFDDTLRSLSVGLKSAAMRLNPQEALTVRTMIAPELRQLVNEGVRIGRALRPDARRAIELAADQLELPAIEAKRRILAVLDELRADATSWSEKGSVVREGWSDVSFAEILDRLRYEFDHVGLRSAVA